MTITVSSYADQQTIANYSTTRNPLLKVNYKSYCQLLVICINISLSALFVGYSLVYIGAFPNFKTIADIYNFEDSYFNQSFVNGLVPVGAMIGALSSSQIIKRFSRRNGFLVTNVVAVLGIGFLMIQVFPTLIIGRILQGICTGIFSAIVPLYINQIVTPDSSNLGSLNQIFIAGGQGFCFLLYLIMIKISEDIYIQWDIIAYFLLIPIAIQSAILLFVLPYNTPKYLYQIGKRQEAIELITMIYRQQFVEEAISKFEGARSSITSDGGDRVAVKQQITGNASSNKFQNSKIAIFFAIHIALLQQLAGVNAIVVYGKQTIAKINSNQDLINSLQIVIATLPAVMAVFSIKLMKVKGRKFIIQMGTLISIFCLAAMVLAFSLINSVQQKLPLQLLVIGAMMIYMASFGLSLGPVVWLYIPEIVQPNIIPYSTMVNLTGASFCIIAFPLFNRTNPDSQDVNYTDTVIVFSVFLAWCIVSFLINAKIMVQTKDKSRRKIFDQYHSMKIC